MKKIAKKITAIMLSLAMLLGCVPSFVNEASANGISTIADVLNTVEFPTSGTWNNSPNDAWVSSEGRKLYKWDNNCLFCFIGSNTSQLPALNENVDSTEDGYIFTDSTYTTFKFVMTGGELTSIIISNDTLPCDYVGTYKPVPKSHTELATLIANASAGSTIELDSDYIFTDGDDTNSIEINKELTIKLNGHTIDGNGKTNTIFTVINGGKLIFNNSSGYIKNAKESNVIINEGGVVVSDACTIDGGREGFYVKEGGILVCNNVNITNMTNAGMYIRNGGLLIFDGGIISNCHYGIDLRGTGYFGKQPIVKENDKHNISFTTNAEIYTGAYDNIKNTGYSTQNMHSDAYLSFYYFNLKDTDTEKLLAQGHENNPNIVNCIEIENADCKLSINDNNEFIIKRIFKIKFRLFPESGLILQSDIDNILEYRKTATLSGADDFSLSYGDVEGKYYELIDFTFGSKAQADLIETIEFEGIDITDKKVTGNVTRDNVRNIAISGQGGCAWGRLDDTTIIAAKYLKLSDRIDYTFGGTTVGSNIKDVTITRKLNGENIATPPLVSFYEVPSTGNNVKIEGDSLETAKFEADKKYLIEVKDTLNDSDNDNADCAFVDGELFTKVASISGNPKSTEWTLADRGEVTLEYVFTPSNPPSSGTSKKYKVNDNDTAEKVSGSGKKGSTRTIIPEEGRKVTNVTVTDKKGNPIEVTMNEDGTYSFIQPASDVIIDVDYAAREIKLELGTVGASIDGIAVNEYVTPKVRGNEVMLPVRFIAENLGAKVDWNEKEPNMIYITRGDKKIEIKLGSNVFKVNGEEFTLDSASFAEGNRTYVPFKLIEKALNATVELGSTNSNEIAIKEF